MRAAHVSGLLVDAAAAVPRLFRMQQSARRTRVAAAETEALGASVQNRSRTSTSYSVSNTQVISDLHLQFAMLLNRPGLNFCIIISSVKTGIAPILLRQ